MKAKRVFDGQRGLITSIFVASAFVNILILTAPIYMLQLFSRVLSSGSIPTLIALTIGAAIAIFFFFLFDAIRQRLVVRLGTRLEARVGPQILTALMNRDIPDAQRHAQPVRDLQELRSFVNSPVLIALLDAPWSVFFVAVIFAFHPLLGVVALTGLTILFVLGGLNEYFGREPNAAANEAQVEANRAAEEMLQNAEVVHAMGGSRKMVERWTFKSFAAIVFSTLAADRVAVIGSLAKMVRMGLQIAVLGTGVVLVLQGQLSPGLMIGASILLGRAASPVEQSISGWSALQRARGAKQRLNEILSHMQEVEQRMELPEPEGRLSVEDATVVLPGRQDPVLFGVSFDLRPGQSLGLIGPSGAGKTTLVRALAGLQPLNRGYVRLDDAALTDWPAEQLGRHVGFLPQRVELFEGTVAENIALMDREARPSDIVAAAKMAQVHDLILQLPGGYNYEVGARGGHLSAGQRQRIGLARAFFGERKLIVLDEPNANLDPEGEAALAAAIAAATARGSIVVVVTHRMNLLREVSHAAVMRGGRLEKIGEARGILELESTLAKQPSVGEDGKVTFLRSRNGGEEQGGTKAMGDSA